MMSVCLYVYLYVCDNSKYPSSGESAFYKKNTFAHYLSNGILGTDVALLDAELQQLSYRAFFSRFCNFLLFISAQVPVSVQNPPEIILHSNCYNSAPMKATKVPKVPF